MTLRQMHWIALSWLLGAMLCTPTSAAPSSAQIPLCPGLTIFTAITQPEGDYESIKTVESIDSRTVRLKYSSEQPPERLGGGLRIRKLNLTLVIRIDDLLNAKHYEQIFGTNLPAEMPGTTAIGVSGAVLSALKRSGEAELGMFNLPPVLPGASAKVANVFDYSENYKIRRVESGSVMLPLIVNNVRTELAAIHAAGRGDYHGYKAEFFFLDNQENPLALKWRLGIGADSGAKAGGDRERLQVIKIAYKCSTPPAGQSWLERALA